jgi:hypothetical protein
MLQLPIYAGCLVLNSRATFTATAALKPPQTTCLCVSPTSVKALLIYPFMHRSLRKALCVPSYESPNTITESNKPTSRAPWVKGPSQQPHNACWSSYLVLNNRAEQCPQGYFMNGVLRRRISWHFLCTRKLLGLRQYSRNAKAKKDPKEVLFRIIPLQWRHLCVPYRYPLAQRK